MLSWVNRYSYWHCTNSLFPHPVDVMGPKGSWSTSFVTRDDVSRLAAPKGPIGPCFLVKIGVGQNHQPLKWMVCGSKTTLKWQFASMVNTWLWTWKIERKIGTWGYHLTKPVMEISRLPKVNPVAPGMLLGLMIHILYYSHPGVEHWYILSLFDHIRWWLLQKTHKTYLGHIVKECRLRNKKVIIGVNRSVNHRFQPPLSTWLKLRYAEIFIVGEHSWASKIGKTIS